MRRAARVLTLSEESRFQMMRVYGLRQEQIEVTPLGVSEAFATPPEYAHHTLQEVKEIARSITKERLGIEVPFLLAVGVIQPRKNLPLLVEAFGRAKQSANLPHHLVLTGKPGWGAQAEELQRVFAATGASPDSLCYTGYVEDDLLPWLYRAATAFAYPSLYEGFGLPPLEAMKAGTPVLVSDAPPMPEVAGDAAMVVPARSVEAWSSAIAEALTNESLQFDLIAKGFERSNQFHWDDTARQVRAIYSDVLTRTRR
jgi:glycosyltransferase involved in cell wall biosynthesis